MAVRAKLVTVMVMKVKIVDSDACDCTGRTSFSRTVLPENA